MARSGDCTHRSNTLFPLLPSRQMLPPQTLRTYSAHARSSVTPSSPSARTDTRRTHHAASNAAQTLRRPRRAHIERTAATEGGLTPLAYLKQYVMPGDVAASTTLSFAQGARFAVSRETIRARPLAYYQRLLKTVSQSADPAAGYYLGVSRPPRPTHTLPQRCTAPC